MKIIWLIKFIQNKILPEPKIEPEIEVKESKEDKLKEYKK